MKALGFEEMLLRILTAFIAGAIIGWERENRGRPAGLRTTILACVASAIAMVLSEVLFVQSGTASSSWRPDPARLAAGILTGIGFLGAGTILRHADEIRGVTTAATLWFVTVLGLTFGNGQFLLGFLGTGMALVILFVLPLFERHIPTDRYATVSITTPIDAIAIEEFKARIRRCGPTIKSTQFRYHFDKQQQTIICELRLKRSAEAEISGKVLADLRQYPGIVRLLWS